MTKTTDKVAGERTQEITRKFRVVEIPAWAKQALSDCITANIETERRVKTPEAKAQLRAAIWRDHQALQLLYEFPNSIAAERRPDLRHNNQTLPPLRERGNNTDKNQ